MDDEGHGWIDGAIANCMSSRTRRDVGILG